MKKTYPPKTICVVCFNTKNEINGRCLEKRRHIWNKEDFTIEVQSIPHSSQLKLDKVD